MLIRVESIRSDAVPAGVRHFIDDPLPGAVLAEDAPLVLRGWVFSRTMRIEGVEVLTERGRSVHPLEEHRPALNRQLGLGRDLALGFRAALDARQALGRVTVRGLAAGGPGFPLCSLELRELDKSEAGRPRRIFFMHIAKTAGSSVNALALRHFPPERCVTHVESYHLRPDMDVLELQDKLFVSGHVTVPVALSRRYINEHFSTFTLLREPLAHLRSHIAWVKRLGLPEHARECARHPVYIQGMASRLNKMSLEEFIADMGELENNLFDNAQTRYLANAFSCALDDGHLELALRALRGFDLVGLNEEFEQSMRVLARFMGWDEPGSMPRENVAGRKWSWPELGVEPEHPALRRLTRLDGVLYAEARRLFAAARDKWLAQEVAQ